METQLVRPVVFAFGLTLADRSHIEAVAALLIGVGFLRHRIEVPGLHPLNADQLTELLTPAVQALLDTTSRHPPTQREQRQQPH